ncbi:PIG-L family deacetylase [Xylophilus sp. Kf1]|nr:PIG-L family deacetylase [Xylophilus sp. Kf1]
MDSVNEDSGSRHIGEGDGTPESIWLNAPALAALPGIAIDHLLPPGSRAVVVAPHPDDEVLSVGGLLAELAARAHPVCIVAVTDGDASHPGSGRWSPAELAAVRRTETENAIDCLGLSRATVMRLGVADGGVQAALEELTRQLALCLTPQDVVFSTWRLDGHPDHEATARACMAATTRVGARLVEVPVWAWHWSHPDDPRWPWHRAQRLDLSADAGQRKRQAVKAFASQIEPDPSTGAAPILRASTVARAARPFEVMFL